MLIAFAGPSLSGVPAPLGIEMRPPARRDDVRRAADEGARAILIIDGAFGDGPSVGHKEILLALARGVRVIGAASMGALRAAECRDWGMEGVGRIYDDYASGRRIADADVALLHGPASLGYCPVTLPLVDVDHFADIVLLGRLGLLGPAGALRAAARALHFSNRTWPAMLDLMGLNAAGRQELIHAISSSFTSLKRRDAMEAIATVAPGAGLAG